MVALYTMYYCISFLSSKVATAFPLRYSSAKNRKTDDLYSMQILYCFLKTKTVAFFILPKKIKCVFQIKTRVGRIKVDSNDDYHS